MVLLALPAWTHIACAADRNILIVLSKSNDLYLDVFQAIEVELSGQFAEKVVLHKLNAMDIESGKTPVDPTKMDLVVSIGTKAAKLIATWQSSAPFLYTLLPKSTIDQILTDVPLMANRSFAVALDQPFSRELRLAKLVLKKVNSAGVLLGPDSQFNKDELIRQSNLVGITLEFVEIDENSFGYANSRNLLERIDAILTLPDPVALSPQRTKWLLYQSYERNIPIISFSHSFVNAGALAAVFSTPQQIGKQAGEIATRILNRSELPTRLVYPKYFDVAINHAVARSLGLTIDNENQLVESIKGMENDLR